MQPYIQAIRRLPVRQLLPRGNRQYEIQLDGSQTLMIHIALNGQVRIDEPAQRRLGGNHHE
ncbi:hypothetical protein [Ectothiorhodospira shaposhnikovii]|uniref:hypothetical protein n=1 Tax=Ectothiorhodospira shaposhnikovii TaxID=1054 RepID=UPI001904BE4B|nr:hypothetical protein [Ectothiorhodospira shaposhnikovii]MBK1674721.1 hypothetical protein [Ectothiorhodospira shaposhnikovii]